MATKRGPYAKSDQRRKALSEATLRLIRENGHRRVAVSDVAALVGTSEPTVYYHYPTKESLLIAALRQHDEDNARAQGTHEGAIAEMGARAAAGVLRTNYGRMYNELAGAAADHDHPANPFFRERWARSLETVAWDIRRLQNVGRVPAEVEPLVAARLILAAWEGLQLQWMQGAEFDIRALIETQIRAILGPDALD